jgi:predicted methyltransferase
MKAKSPLRVIGLLTLLASSVDAAPAAPPMAGKMPTTIAAALADPRRPVEQTLLDARRKPEIVIAFAGIKPGDQVADFMPGNAYFTRIFSDVVGPRGHIYAFIPTEQIANCSPTEIAGTRALAHDPGYSNVSVLSESVTRFRLPRKLDVLWTAQNYHDLHDSFMGPANIDRLLKAFFRALKPGGVFLVIDHVAEPGSGLRDTETLHRIDPARMRSEIEAAGFVFEAQSDALRNPSDDHKRTVFDPVLRASTDQVVLRFRKPASSGR